MIKCSKHPDNSAVAVCSMCGKGVCRECKVKLVQRDYCQSCADDIVKEGALVAIRKLYEILEEKRKHHRVHVLVPVELTPVGEGVFYKGIIHNVSAGGVAVIADKLIDINEVIVLNFRLPNGSVMEDVQAGVVRAEKIGDKYNLGLLFMNMLDKQKVIDDFIFNVKKKKFSESNGFDMSNFVV